MSDGYFPNFQVSPVEVLVERKVLSILRCVFMRNLNKLSNKGNCFEIPKQMIM